MTDIKESSHSTDNPLVFGWTPRSLQSMTALELALLCWRHEMSNLYPDEMNYLRKFWFDCHKLTSGDIFHAPNRIVQLIDYHIKQFVEIFQNWIYVNLTICMNRNDEFKTEQVLKVLKNISIEPCGYIIDVKTVRKLITGDIFDPLDQFELACKYSLQADIERLWPLVSENMPINDNTRFSSKCYYWCFRMRNELDKIPGDEENSPEFRLLSHDHGICHSWSDVEFFWDKLKTEERISKLTMAYFLIGQTSHHVLSKLNRTQLEFVLTRIPNAIMICLSTYDYTFDYALKTWNFMKNFVTGEQFFDILYVLWKKAYCSTNIFWYEGGRFDILLYEIWSVAPPVLKNYVLVNHVEKFFNDLQNSLRSMENYGCDLRFLRCLLTDTKFESRNELWRRNWRKFIMLATPDVFDNFLRLCFKNQIDIAEFKENHMLNFEQLCGNLEGYIKAGFSCELFEFLRYFSFEENRMAQLKKIIIEWFLVHAYAYDSKSVSNSVINSMVNFIDNNVAIAVSPAIISADEFKEFFTRFNNTSSLIFSAEGFKEFFIRFNLNEFFHVIEIGGFNRLKNIIDSVLPSNNKYLIEVKQLLYEHCLRKLRSGDCKIRYMREWNAFSEWCAPSQQEFRKALPVDHIFEILLTNVIREIPRSSEIKSLDGNYVGLCFYADQIKLTYSFLNNFLIWYFEDDATKRKKLSKIDFDEDTIVKMLREGNDSIISDVVDWFFDEDAEKIEQFRSRVIDK